MRQNRATGDARGGVDACGAVDVKGVTDALWA
jgi:hypothetical protein